eukprot:3938163-Rhodomonas_salina.4
MRVCLASVADAQAVWLRLDSETLLPVTDVAVMAPGCGTRDATTGRPSSRWSKPLSSPLPLQVRPVLPQSSSSTMIIIALSPCHGPSHTTPASRPACLPEPCHCGAPL